MLPPRLYSWTPQDALIAVLHETRARYPGRRVRLHPQFYTVNGAVPLSAQVNRDDTPPFKMHHDGPPEIFNRMTAHIRIDNSGDFYLCGLSSWELFNDAADAGGPVPTLSNSLRLSIYDERSGYYLFGEDAFKYPAIALTGYLGDPYWLALPLRVERGSSLRVEMSTGKAVTPGGFDDLDGHHSLLLHGAQVIVR